MPQMLGLGFVNPELKRAQQLALLNGSTAIPQQMPRQGPPPISSDIAGGPMAAPSQVQPPPPSPAQMQQSSQQVPINIGPPTAEMIGGGAVPPPAEAEDDPNAMPKWAKIAGAIGHVLLSIDAGYNGRGMPSTPDYLDPAKEQDQAMQVSEFLVNTTARAWEVARKAPPGVREPMLEQFKQAIKRVAPDFDFDGFIDSMQDDPERMDALAPDLATLSEDAKRMVMSQINARGGDAAAAAGVIKDDDFMAGIMDYEDGRNTPSLKMKLGAIKQAMGAAKMPPDILSDASPDGFRQFNENLPERYRLSPSELGTLKRNADLQAIIGLGGPPPAPDQDRTLEQRAGRSPAPRPMRQAAPAYGEGDDDEIEEPVAPAASPRRAERPTTKPRSAPRAPSSQQPRRPQDRQPAPQPRKPGGNAFLDGLVERADAAQDAMRKRGVKPEDFVPAAKAQADKMNRWLDENPEADRYPVERDAPPRREARQPERREREPDREQPQRFKVPKDMTLPGIGKVKAGDAVIYDQSTGKYRRG